MQGASEPWHQDCIRRHRQPPHARRLNSVWSHRKSIEKLLDAAHITANKNTIPNDPQKPFVTSGIRLGTPAATSRGLKEDDFDKVAEAIAMIIKEGESAVEPAKAIIKTLTDKYPLAF